jgi:cell division protein FtsB
VQAEPFDSRRERFVTQLRARVDAMEEQLKTVRARGAQETELEDTRARVNKLKEDVDRLGNASADDWWEITSKRVSEYIDRVEPSIRRLDDVKI